MKPTNLLAILIILTLCVSCKKPEFASADPAPEAVKSDRPITFEMNNLNWLASNSSFIFVGRLSAKNE